MRLKCVDGTVREFEVAHADADHMPDGSRHSGYSDARCKLCGYNFGCHDTRILKGRFKNHTCKKEN